MKIFIFNSIHYVMKSEALLKSEGISVDLIPVPKEIHTNCGMAISTADNHAEKTKEILLKNNIDFQIYTFNEEVNFFIQDVS